MRGEELSHLELLLRFGILVVAGKVGLFEVVQPSDTGIAVVDALRRNEVLAGVYGEKYLLVDFGTHTLRYLLGDDVDADDENIQYRMEAGDGCALSKGAIRVTKEGAQLKLVFHGLTDSENYLIADNLDYDSLSPRELIGNSQWKKMSEYDQNKVLDEDSQWRYWKESKEAAMTVSSNDVTKTIKIFTDKYNAYSGRHDFLCNMGYSRSGVRTMTITFANTGVYTYDKLRVVSQPVQGIEAKTVKLGEEALENVKMGTNEIAGNISISKKKALVLSVPYSKGFTAYVDGKETKLQKANTMFMALELEPGSHEIRLTYCTPYLKAGLALSLAGLVVYFMLVAVRRKKRC